MDKDKFLSLTKGFFQHITNEFSDYASKCLCPNLRKIEKNLLVSVSLSTQLKALKGPSFPLFQSFSLLLSS